MYGDFLSYMLGYSLIFITWLSLFFPKTVTIDLEKDLIQKSVCFYKYPLYTYYKIHNLNNIKIISSIRTDTGDDIGVGSTKFYIELITTNPEKSFLLVTLRAIEGVKLLKNILSNYLNIPFDIT
ncbi:MAG: hypothetical protein H0V01_04730 [Bacteroidetes bacterium]|nr:hypothetical protein [Bacteroidota bacterium]HET6242985.1 hypothetical protein [Bacteroidia bacterium]